ncbi:MAG: hypothetical protein AB7H94_21845 [Lautropia sp.]
MAIEPRRPRADELQAVQAHIARSINALCSRHGFGEPARARPAEFQAEAFAEDPEGFGVACEGDASFAWSSGRFWFLAELFVAPDRQAAGVGNRLHVRRSRRHLVGRGIGNARHVPSLAAEGFGMLARGEGPGMFPMLRSCDPAIRRIAGRSEVACPSTTTR